MSPSAWGGVGAPRDNVDNTVRVWWVLSTQSRLLQPDGCPSPWAHLGSPHLTCWQFSAPALTHTHPHTHTHTHSHPHPAFLLP